MKTSTFTARAKGTRRRVPLVPQGKRHPATAQRLGKKGGATSVLFRLIDEHSSRAALKAAALHSNL
jgi:hypothetical protein